MCGARQEALVLRCAVDHATRANPQHADECILNGACRDFNCCVAGGNCGASVPPATLGVLACGRVSAAIAMQAPYVAVQPSPLWVGAALRRRPLCAQGGSPVVLVS
eukprot:jgi/Ulvmu1/8577/UM045_0019.1